MKSFFQLIRHLAVLFFILILSSCSPPATQNDGSRPRPSPQMNKPIIKNSQATPKKENEMYKPMRELALSMKADRVKSMLQGGKTTVYGLIIERKIRDTYTTTFGLSDGTASYYSSRGASTIGGGGDANASTLAMFMVGTVSKDHFTECPVDGEIELPNEDEISFIVLSTMGRYNCRIKYSDLDSSGWSEVYNFGGRLQGALDKARY